MDLSSYVNVYASLFLFLSMFQQATNQRVTDLSMVPVMDTGATLILDVDLVKHNTCRLSAYQRSINQDLELI